jgi:HPt (histidine-containing phosphotransfer) domain-containing protein
VRREDLRAMMVRWAQAGPATTAPAPLTTDILEELRALARELPAEYDALVDSYVGEGRVALETIHAAGARDDAGALMLAAHKLRGSSASIGAPALAELCAALERAGLRADAHLHAQIAAEFAVVSAALDAERIRA